MGELIGRVVGAITSSMLMGVLCALIVLILPDRMRVARNAATVALPTAALVGFFSLLVAVGVSALLAITICLVPIVFVGWLILGAIIIVGWAVIAEPVGHLVLRRWHVYAPPMVAAAIGGMALTAAVWLLSLLPLVGVFTGLLIASTGLGSLMLTRLGKRSYPQRLAL